jgi:hypothetical protein
MGGCCSSAKDTRMTRVLPLALLLSVAHDWGLILIALGVGVFLGVILLGMALRRAIENEIGRWFGWCVLICAVALSAHAQRRPGQRTTIPTETHTVDAPEWRYADGTSRYTNLKSELRCTASDGREYVTTTRDANMAFVFVTPAGVHFDECPYPSAHVEDTVRVGILYNRPSITIPDPAKMGLDPKRDAVVYDDSKHLWMIVLAAELQKAPAQGFTREVWPFDIFIPAPAPIGPPGRRRGVVPPFVLPVGIELHAMPMRSILDWMTANAPGVYIVITDGKVWFIRERQGLPIPEGWRRVWP